MSEQIDHNNYTALLAIMEAFCASAPDMPVSEAWPLIQKVESNTRALSVRAAIISGAGGGSGVWTIPTQDTSADDTAAWIHYSSSEVAKNIREFVKDRKIIWAVKELRMATAQSLKTSKAAVELYRDLY